MSMRVFSNGTRIAAIALVSFASIFASAKPNYDESKVPPYTLENPLTFADGRKVQTKSDWRRRRDECFAACIANQTGLGGVPLTKRFFVVNVATETRKESAKE